ncbi:MAG: tRNA pseudouridine(38-40) synthase TruA [Bacteroidales bacterium]|nr:tRNA pseudouridine(38-40) synthase TruA [Bacteroidales bacterium]
MQANEIEKNNGELKRYALVLQYNGRNYHGWQKQPGDASIQETLEICFSNVLKAETQVWGCGRTDTGVHAREYVAHFDAKPMTKDEINNFLWKMNSYLPNDIRLLSMKIVNNDFNSRFDAISRTYKYYITHTKQPFNDDFSCFIPQKLDLNLMNIAAKMLYQYDDFTSFSKLHTQVNNNICKIMYAHWEKSEEYIVFTIKANRFLRNMVRSIVGTMIDVGKGKITPDDFAKIIEAQDRSKAGVSVPAKALFLEKIEYDRTIF